MTMPSQPGANPAAATQATSRAPGLADLATLPLEEPNRRVLDHLSKDIVSSSAAWRGRKIAEAHGLMALSQIAPRLRIHYLDLRTELIAQIELMDTPVPCRTPGSSDIHIERGAMLTILYPEAILTGPIPGAGPIRILEPRNVYHSNVGPFEERAPALCLGANVPRGFPLRELVLSSYAALTLQAISLDRMDPAGVLNGDATLWWQANTQRIPLTTESFLGRSHVDPCWSGESEGTGTDGESRS